MGSHDFIRFPPYQPQLTAPLVALLGEIQALLKQVERIPVPPAVRQELLTLYLAKAVHGTTAIEGNRLSEDEVLQLIKSPDRTTKPNDYNEQEVRNVLDAMNEIAKGIRENTDERFSVEQLNHYHRKIILHTGSPNYNDDEIGMLRKQSVEVGRYLAPPAAECPDLLDKFCEWLNEANPYPAAHESYELAWQVVRAVIAHVYFAWIHPYCDGNGRLSRLIEFKLMLRAGVPTIAAHLLCNLYNKRRPQYHYELSQSFGDYHNGVYPPQADVHGFVMFALAGLRDELESQCQVIYNAQITAIWHNLIHSSFPKKLSTAQSRRKQLALDLTQPKFQSPVLFREIREITPAVALAYVNASDATLRNDLNLLIDMGLALRTDEGYKPNTDILFGLVPGTAQE